MARVPLIGEDEPQLAGLIAHLKAQRGGRLINLYRVLLNAPPLAQAWLAFNSAVRYSTTLPQAIVELAILRVSALNGAHYQLRVHGPKHALAAGLSVEQVDAIAGTAAGAPLPAALFDARQRAVLACADAITREIEPAAAVWAGFAEHFDARQQVELTVLISAYNMHTRVARALQIDTEPPSPDRP